MGVYTWRAKEGLLLCHVLVVVVADMAHTWGSDVGWLVVVGIAKCTSSKIGTDEKCRA